VKHRVALEVLNAMLLKVFVVYEERHYFSITEIHRANSCLKENGCYNTKDGRRRSFRNT
jgi:hypothetical protein